MGEEGDGSLSEGNGRCKLIKDGVYLKDEWGKEDGVYMKEKGNGDMGRL